jgi:hypothetical protein
MKRTNSNSERLNEYWGNPLLAAIKRPFQWAAGTRPVDDAAQLRAEAQQELHLAYRELSKRRQDEMELRLRSKRLVAEIVDYEHKEMRLVRESLSHDSTSTILILRTE